MRPKEFKPPKGGFLCQKFGNQARLARAFLFGDHSVMRILTMKETALAVKKSRSGIYSALDSGSAYYDPDFPRPIRLSARKIGFLEEGIKAWVTAKAALGWSPQPVCKRKNEQDAAPTAEAPPIGKVAEERRAAK